MYIERERHRYIFRCLDIDIDIDRSISIEPEVQSACGSWLTPVGPARRMYLYISMFRERAHQIRAPAECGGRRLEPEYMYISSSISIESTSKVYRSRAPVKVADAATTRIQIYLHMQIYASRAPVNGGRRLSDPCIYICIYICVYIYRSIYIFLQIQSAFERALTPVRTRIQIYLYIYRSRAREWQPTMVTRQWVYRYRDLYGR